MPIAVCVRCVRMTLPTRLPSEIEFDDGEIEVELEEADDDD
jgi:hypothetical protein